MEKCEGVGKRLEKRRGFGLRTGRRLVVVETGQGGEVGGGLGKRGAVEALHKRDPSYIIVYVNRAGKQRSVRMIKVARTI